jgi:D-alanyl-D-alanine carboxypeptidase
VSLTGSGAAKGQRPLSSVVKLRILPNRQTKMITTFAAMRFLQKFFWDETQVEEKGICCS